MRCLECGNDGLVAYIEIRKTVPLADKGGSVKVAGEKVTQKDLKEFWDKEFDGEVKQVRGPIYCTDCETEHCYVKGGDDPGLKLGNHEEVKENL